MKKIFVLALSALLIFSFTAVAFADIQLGGDMRARGILKDGYSWADGADDMDRYYDQRLRLTATGDTGNGWMAKARVTVSEGKWDGTGQTEGAVSVDTDDYAYITGPAGDWTLSIGLQHANWGNKFMTWAVNTDRIKATTKMNDVTVGVFTDKKAEVNNGEADADYDDYGAIAIGKVGDFTAGIIGVMYNNSADDTGTFLDVFFRGPAGPIALAGEVAFKAGDLFEDSAGNSQMGFFVAGTMDLDAAKASAGIAYAANSLSTSNYFMPTLGFGTVQPTAVGQFGANDDDSAYAIFFGVDFAQDMMAYGAKIAYADLSTEDDDTEAIELDLTFKYTIADNVKYDANFMYMMPTAEVDNIMGLNHRIQINF